MIGMADDVREMGCGIPESPADGDFDARCGGARCRADGTWALRRIPYRDRIHRPDDKALSETKR